MNEKTIKKKIQEKLKEENVIVPLDCIEFINDNVSDIFIWFNKKSKYFRRMEHDSESPFIHAPIIGVSDELKNVIKKYGEKSRHLLYKDSKINDIVAIRLIYSKMFEGDDTL